MIGSQSRVYSKEANKKRKTAHRLETTRRHVQQLNESESVITTHTSSAETTQEISDRLRVENKQEVISTLNEVQRRTLQHSAIAIIGKVPILKRILTTITKLADPATAAWDAECMRLKKRNTSYHLTHCQWSQLLIYTADMDVKTRTTILSHVFMYKVLLFQSRGVETEMPILFGDVSMRDCQIFDIVCDFEVRFPYSEKSHSETCFEVQNIPVKVFQLFDINMFENLLISVKNEMMANLPDDCTINVTK